MTSFESVSTWCQPVPSRTSPGRRGVVARVAEAVDGLSPGRLRVAVDGRSGAGKTTFGHELAAELRARGRSTARASLDDFKHPWRHAREHGYDRTSGRGYYENAYDLAAVRAELLTPAGPRGSGRVTLCGHDPLTGVDHRSTRVELLDDTVLVVDSVFAFRPEIDELWDYRIWLEVGAEDALRRGIARDTDREGAAEAEALHRNRYHVAEAHYLSVADAPGRADVLVENTDLDAPVLLVRRP
ncbi:uridine kinase [Kineococcus sp. R8]|uniref:uridine kinase n=1 Tax=Kineococcus siccus TaxID=2696567 RepID=UPI001412335B|nr:uridine kinase [Kineococcus siccus]NAZ84087.1 uridine kinase [Kineococcus siccus]